MNKHVLQFENKPLHVTATNFSSTLKPQTYSYIYPKQIDFQLDKFYTYLYGISAAMLRLHCEHSHMTMSARSCDDNTGQRHSTVGGKSECLRDISRR